MINSHTLSVGRTCCLNCYSAYPSHPHSQAATSRSSRTALLSSRSATPATRCLPTSRRRLCACSPCSWMAACLLNKNPVRHVFSGRVCLKKGCLIEYKACSSFKRNLPPRARLNERDTLLFKHLLDSIDTSCGPLYKASGILYILQIATASACIPQQALFCYVVAWQVQFT